MVQKMLENPVVKSEVEKLNREEFVMFDEILAARNALLRCMSYGNRHIN